MGGAADNAADVLCLYDGTVDRSLDTTGGYGSYVQTSSMITNGHVFYTLCPFGQTLCRSRTVGEAGGRALEESGEPPATSRANTLCISTSKCPATGWAATSWPTWWTSARTSQQGGAAVIRWRRQPPSTCCHTLRGDHKRQFIMGHNVKAAAQTVQVWLQPNWRFIRARRRIGLQGKGWIFRFDDTSESPTRFYAHYLPNGGPIGRLVAALCDRWQWYTTSKFVQHYLKAGCAKQDGGDVVDKLRVIAGPRSVTLSSKRCDITGCHHYQWSGGSNMTSRSAAAALRFVMQTARSGLSVTWRGDPTRLTKKPGCILWGGNRKCFNALGARTMEGKSTLVTVISVLSAVITPLAALFVAYGLLSQEKAELWVALAVALLGALSAIAPALVPQLQRQPGGRRHWAMRTGNIESIQRF